LAYVNHIKTDIIVKYQYNTYSVRPKQLPKGERAWFRLPSAIYLIISRDRRFWYCKCTISQVSKVIWQKVASPTCHFSQLRMDSFDHNRI